MHAEERAHHQRQQGEGEVGQPLGADRPPRRDVAHVDQGGLAPHLGHGHLAEQGRELQRRVPADDVRVQPQSRAHHQPGAGHHRHRHPRRPHPGDAVDHEPRRTRGRPAPPALIQVAACDDEPAEHEEQLHADPAGAQDGVHARELVDVGHELALEVEENHPRRGHDAQPGQRPDLGPRPAGATRDR